MIVSIATDLASGTIAVAGGGNNAAGAATTTVAGAATTSESGAADLGTIGAAASKAPELYVAVMELPFIASEEDARRVVEDPAAKRDLEAVIAGLLGVPHSEVSVGWEKRRAAAGSGRRLESLLLAHVAVRAPDAQVAQELVNALNAVEPGRIEQGLGKRLASRGIVESEDALSLGSYTPAVVAFLAPVASSTALSTQVVPPTSSAPETTEPSTAPTRTEPSSVDISSAGRALLATILGMAVVLVGMCGM